MNLQHIRQVRSELLTMFSIALASVEGEQSVERFLLEMPVRHNSIRVIAIGKAAASMMQGALNVLGEEIQAGLVISKSEYLREHSEVNLNACITVIESDHPVPSERSLQAGQCLLDFVRETTRDNRLLFLISGGTSALVEVLADTVSVEQLADLNRWCLSHAQSIEQINFLRKSISKIKAGRLLNYIETPDCIQLSISDVQNNNLAVIGSGLLVVDDDDDVDEANFLNKQNFPDWINALENTPSMTSLPVSVEHHIIADNQRAREAVKQYALQHRWPVHLEQEVFSEVTLAAQQISETLIAGDAGIYIWGGECVITLPIEPGQGGRCQSLALAIAEYIKDEDIVVLVAGTDGCDGPGGDAGAIVDGLTLERGQSAGLDSTVELKKANAGYYLAELGDLIDTGPTGTNVMDLIIAIKGPLNYSPPEHNCLE